MRNSWAGKLLVGAAALVVLIGIVLHFSNRSPQPVANTPPAVSQKPESAPSKTFSSRSQPSTPAEESPAQPDDEIAKLLALKLPREKIEEYLTLHHRDAASLLAAFHGSGNAENPFGDINYLKEAATNFPNDPHVQHIVLARNAFPEERRKWLEAFKASSPDNSLANYLSARDYFKNGQPDAAIKELLEATSKSQFGNYAMETILAEAELYRASGKSPMEANMAAMSAMAGDNLPELATLKGLAQAMADLQKLYLNADDTSSAQHLAEMGLALANRLNSGKGAESAISQITGIAIESILLQNLDQNTRYDFLGGKTPKERSDEMLLQRGAISTLIQDAHAAFSRMTEAEMLSYFDRQRLYGDLEAARWLQQRYGTNSR